MAKSLATAPTTLEPQTTAPHNNPWEQTIQYAIGWIYKRIPNSAEVLATSAPTGVFGAVFEDFVNKLGSNPAAKSWIRDLYKAVGTLWAASIGAELGGTGVKYDQGHVYSAFLKPCSKLGLIGYGYFTGTDDLQEISRVSNIVGELISRYFANMSILKQSMNDTSTDYLDFASKNTNTTLLTQASIEGITKSGTADMVGSLIAYLGVPQLLKSSTLLIENTFIKLALSSGISFTDKQTLFGKYNTIIAHDGPSTFNKIMSFATLSAIDISCKIGSEVLVTYILAPGVRIVQDGTWPAIAYLKDSITSYTKQGEHIEITEHKLNPSNDVVKSSTMNDIEVIYNGGSNNILDSNCDDNCQFSSDEYDSGHEF